MFTALIVGCAGRCTSRKNPNDLSSRAKKVVKVFLALESFLSMIAVVLGFLIRTSSLPNWSFLSFLKDRMDIANIMLGVGASEIVLPYVLGIVKCIHDF